jgi:hypothetical protein
LQKPNGAQMQIPPQSAPPNHGLQLSVGSSTHMPLPGHGNAAMPPQVFFVLESGVQMPASQCVPEAHFTV